jgi:hypothetical protein
MNSYNQETRLYYTRGKAAPSKTKVIAKPSPIQDKKKLASLIITLSMIAGILSMNTKSEGANSLPHREYPITSQGYDVEISAKPKLVDFKSIRTQTSKGKMGAEYGRLLGLPVESAEAIDVPKVANVNWEKSISHLWDLKLGRRNVSDSARANASKVVSDYANKPKDLKTISQFVKQVDRSAVEMHAQIDFKALCSAVNVEHCSSLVRLTKRIRGRNLVSYGMTELFPSDNGEFNYIALDTILRNAGETYLDAVPAGYDRLLSKGFYQFTSFAIRRDDSGRMGGVTIVDTYAGKKLGDSVIGLDYKDAHKAAYAMAVYNLAQVMRTMSARDADTLATKCDIAQVTEAIAIAHHLPADAWVATRTWVSHGCSKPIQSYLTKALVIYADKTASNYKALSAHI